MVCAPATYALGLHASLVVMGAPQLVMQISASKGGWNLSKVLLNTELIFIGQERYYRQNDLCRAGHGDNLFASRVFYLLIN